MQEILTKNGITAVQFIDSQNGLHQFFFSPHMLQSNVFIEVHAPEEEDLDYEEGEDELDEELEDDLNEEEGDDLVEPGVLEGSMDDDSDDYGSRLSVFMERDKKYYEFLMYSNAVDIVTPVMLVQTILFLVKTIDEAKPDELVPLLTGLSKEQLIPHELEDKKFKIVAKKLIKKRIEIVYQLFRDGKADLN